MSTREACIASWLGARKEADSLGYIVAHHASWAGLLLLRHGDVSEAMASVEPTLFGKGVLAILAQVAGEEAEEGVAC